MKRILIWAILLLSFRAGAERRKEYVSFGPMLHWNFGAVTKSLGLGIEATYWSFPPGHRLFGGDTQIPDQGEPGFGIDLGVEWEQGKIRVYTESEFGMIPAGFAIGPVVECDDTALDLRFGGQGSVWVNIPLLGADIRGRFIAGRPFVAPGLYGKVPVQTR